MSLVVPACALAQARDTTVKVRYGGFVDSYYAWDFGEPATLDRSFFGGALFTTQPARHNEFNVNLAFVEAKLEGARVRGRLALQTGTSVQSNYAGEATNGSVSGPSLSRFMQEAFAGVQIARDTWLDAGIFFSHMGMEGWISRDNPTYTRSLVAEYSPYYSSGVRLTSQLTPKVTGHLHVVNGWQNISENNTGKGVGVRLDFTPMPGSTISYYNFFSDEAGNRLRTFNGVGTKIVAGRLTWLGELDYGTQDAAGGTSSWYGATAVLRAQASARTAIVGRVERFDDRDGALILTGVPGANFRATGGSIGIDHSPASGLVWRTEARLFSNADAVFPDGASAAPSKRNALLVSSLALSF